MAVGHLRQLPDGVEHAGGGLGVADGDRVVVAGGQSVVQHPGGVVLAPLQSDPVHVHPALVTDPGEPLAERAVHQAEDPGLRSVPDGHLHHPRSGGRGHVYRALGSERMPEPGLDPVHQGLGFGRAVADHGSEHGLEDLPPDLRRAREEEVSVVRSPVYRHSTIPWSMSFMPRR